ncbi:MAG: hypothetical protein U9P00_05740, partial [Pseudomonadota bacterium]|nr:hypothetical protein [Pseudomonadota bacterium]
NSHEFNMMCWSDPVITRNPQQDLWRFARRPCLTAWRLPGTTGLGLRPSMAGSDGCTVNYTG